MPSDGSALRFSTGDTDTSDFTVPGVQSPSEYRAAIIRIVLLNRHKRNHWAVQTITNSRKVARLERTADSELRTKKETIMKYSARVVSLVMGLCGVVVPAALAQTPPAPTTPPPAHTTSPPPAQTPQSSHPKASGAAKGAAIGAMGGNAAKGAVIGAGHSRREARRTERKNK